MYALFNVYVYFLETNVANGCCPSPVFFLHFIIFCNILVTDLSFLHHGYGPLLSQQSDFQYSVVPWMCTRRVSPPGINQSNSHLHKYRGLLLNMKSIIVE